jgi:hypothetical protein
VRQTAKFLVADDGGKDMSCVKECACPKTTCPNHKKCCACVIKHKETDSLPFCLFLDNDGDKSLENFYRKLKERFEK